MTSSQIPVPISVRDITNDLQAQSGFGIDPADFANNAARIFSIEWSDRKAWYEQEKMSGKFYATVFNETEEFLSVYDCHAWLHSRVENLN